MKKGSIIAMILCAVFALSAISVVHAGTASGISSFSTTNGLGQDTSGVYAPGDTVLIWWVPLNGVGTVDIQVKDAFGNVVPGLTWADKQPTDTGRVSFSTKGMNGFYEIYFGGQRQGHLKVFEGGSIFVAPESLLGSAMVVGAGFAAFGLIGVVKHNAQKRKKSEKSSMFEV